MLIEELGARIPRIDIDSLEDNVFHAKIHLEAAGGGRRLVDSRPSDALAIALRVSADIFVEEQVLRKATTVDVKQPESEGEGESQGQDPWREFLENLDPDAFGKYKM
jgi:bifunctional DNase/RNase